MLVVEKVSISHICMDGVLEMSGRTLGSLIPWHGAPGLDCVIGRLVSNMAGACLGDLPSSYLLIFRGLLEPSSKARHDCFCCGDSASIHLFPLSSLWSERLASMPCPSRPYGLYALLRVMLYAG